MTALLSTPWPHGLLTLDDWEALPPYDGFRLELVEGVATPVAAPRLRHQIVSSALTARVNHQLPGSLIAVSGVEVVVAGDPPTIRVPDLVVAPTALAAADPPRLAAVDVSLAVEILSDGTRKVDSILKFAEYAEAGIPRYWILDVDGPVTLLAYALGDGAYEVTGEHLGTATLDVAGHPVELDLEALVRR